MYLAVLLGVFVVISGGMGSPFVSSSNAITNHYGNFPTTSPPKIVVGGSTWRNRFSPNFKPINPRYSRPFMKPAINSEPAALPELPTNGVEPNPHPVPMTFLPVFPWPSNMPSKNDIYAMFPRSGSNEFWPRPRVDDRMSHFPMPGQPLPGSNYNNVQQTQRQAPSGAGGAVNQTPVTPPAWVRHALSTVFTTPSTTTVPSTTTTTTTAPTTTTTASEAESNHIWDSTELLKQPTFPEVVPSLSFSSDSDENSVERESEPETTTTTTVATTTRRFVPRYTKIKRPAATLSTKYDFLNNRKIKNLCRPLNPLTDSIPHPDSDQSCDPDLSSWRRSPSCRCRYLVATRNVLGCPVRYHTICWRIKTKN